MDRIDIHIEVPAVKHEDLIKQEEGEPSYIIKERVVKAREIQTKRFRKSKIYCNAQMSEREIKKFCKLDNESLKLLEIAIKKNGIFCKSLFKNN